MKDLKMTNPYEINSLCKSCDQPMRIGITHLCTIPSERSRTDTQNLKELFDEIDTPKAIKADNGKSTLGMIPVEGLRHEAAAFAYGVKKYGRNNYKKGMEWSRCLDAALRHIYAFASKEDIDTESGNHHLGHARACLSMLLYYIDNKKGTDDR